MKTTVCPDDDLVRRALALQKGSTVAAVLEVGLQELIASDRRLSLAEAFGSQPELKPVPRRPFPSADA
jgi:hypothetical protein